MKAKQKVFILGTESGNKINETDTLLVAINDIPTRIKLRSLFESYVQGTGDIKGHSFLSECEIDDGRIVVSENIHISIVDKNDDQNVYFTKMKEPFIQMSDIETDRDAKIVQLEEEWEKVKPQEEGTEIIVKVDEPEIITEAEAESLVEEEEQEESEESEYNKFKSDLIAEGFVCIKCREYELLYNKESKKGALYNKEGDKVGYKKISEENGIKVLRADSEEKDLSFDIN